MSDESIKSNLRHAGWSESQVNEGFVSVDGARKITRSDPGVYNTAKDSSSQPLAYSSGVSVGLSGSDMGENRAFSKKKMLKIAALVIIPLFLIVGGILGYYLINPTLTKYLALKDLGKIESARLQGRVVIKEASGGIDGKQTNSEDALKFLLDGYIDGKEAKSDFIAKMEVPAGYVSPEVNFITIGNKVYFRISKFPFPDIPDQPQVQDTWYYYEDKNEKESEKQPGGDSSSQTWNIDFKKYFSDGKIFKDFKKITDESVEGVDCNQYVFEVDTSKFAEIIIKMANDNGSLMTEGEKTELKNEFAKINGINGSLLIGKKDKMIHRIDVYMVVKEVSIDLSFKASEINQAHAFKAPEGAKSFQDAFGVEDQLLPMFPGQDDTARSPI